MLHIYKRKENVRHHHHQQQHYIYPYIYERKEFFDHHRVQYMINKKTKCCQHPSNSKLTTALKLLFTL